MTPETSSERKPAVNIVGAGVFGLSTLAGRGYRDITVIDRLSYDENLYSYFSGADAVSADMNKIIRPVYGGVTIYQDLSLEAIEGWKIWNSELATGDVPVTRWTATEKLTAIPTLALRVIRGFSAEYLPELTAEGIKVSKTRVCWYNDSFDNHLVVDHVPNTNGLMAAIAGSGHSSKYLPVIGKYIADVMEGVELERPVLEAWRWRKLGERVVLAHRLMEGSDGERALDNVSLTADTALQEVGIRAKL